MLKNSYLEKYKRGKKKISEFEKKIMSEDGNYIINLERPISLKEINKFSNDKLKIFIDDIMSNKKVNNLLYSNSYRRELELNLKHKKILTRNRKSTDDLISSKSRKITQYKSLFNKKEKAIMVDMIKDNISNFKITKSLSMTKLKIKNKEFYKTQQNTEKVNIKLFFKPINEIRYKGYQRSFKACLEKSKSNSNFNLPDVDLKLDNVYSRLYHNMIFHPIKLKFDRRYKIKIEKNKKIKPLTNLEDSNNIKINKNINKEKRQSVFTNPFNVVKKVHNFKVRNIFREYLGKEYLIEQSLTNKQKCWENISGGPGVKAKNPRKINLNKFKRKNIKEKLCFSSENSIEEDDIIDVNDYRDNDLNSNLHLAVKDNNVEFVKYFLDKNYNPNEKNIFGDTPLHYAMELKNKQIIELLINDGGDLDIKNNKGITPFDLSDKEIKAYFKIGNYI